MNAEFSLWLSVTLLWVGYALVLFIVLGRMRDFSRVQEEHERMIGKLLGTLDRDSLRVACEIDQDMARVIWRSEVLRSRLEPSMRRVVEQAFASDADSSL